MALRFGDLTAASSLNATDEFALSLTGSSGSRKITAKNLRTALLAGGSWTAGDYLGFGSTPASAGVIRIGNNSAIAWRNAGDNANLTFKVSASDLFTFDAGLSVTGTVTATAFSGPLTGNVTGNLTGDVTGNVSGTAGSVAASALTGTTLASGVVTSSLTAVGTIGTGVWQGTAVGPTFGGTGLTSYTQGDILYASAANTLAKLAKGTSGQFLQIGPTIPAWADSTVADPLVLNQIYRTKGASGSVLNTATYDITVPSNQAGLIVIRITSPTGSENVGGLLFYVVDTDASGGQVVDASGLLAGIGVTVSFPAADTVRVTNNSGVTIAFNWALAPVFADATA